MAKLNYWITKAKHLHICCIMFDWVLYFVIFTHHNKLGWIIHPIHHVWGVLLGIMLWWETCPSKYLVDSIKWWNLKCEYKNDKIFSCYHWYYQLKTMAISFKTKLPSRAVIETVFTTKDYFTFRSKYLHFSFHILWWSCKTHIFW